VSRIRPIILAGGPGARLWPLSHAERPKPFLKLDGARTLLDHTLARFAAPELFLPPIVACEVAHAPLARTALRAAGVAEPALILEPAARDTAAAVAAAAAERRAAGATDELVLIAPADHVVADVAAFRAGCARAAERAAEGRLVLFGAAPSSAHEGYGYIEAATPEPVADVVAFHEKPARAQAEAFLAGGRHLWNMGLFLASAATFEALLKAHAPEIQAVARRAVAEGARIDGALVLAPEAFAGAPKAAFDRAVVEKARGVSVVRLACGWSDVGSWDAVHDALPHDGEGNALVGDARVLDARNTLIHADGVRVAAIGVEGLAIVATGNEVLVCRLEDAQEVKALVAAMRTKPE
jgi:mannose-1-phosphate guanylyltransferase/mannose-1-phosphate guanylyltransferase/mannose-6-phosphate isomerase